MQYIERRIGSQTIVFDRADNKVFVTFDMPEGYPEETYQISFNNPEDALTGYWVCCNTATDSMNHSENQSLSS